LIRRRDGSHGSISFAELNTTGVPTPFIFEFTALVYEPKNVEKLMSMLANS
jgi:hypothetical protein